MKSLENDKPIASGRIVPLNLERIISSFIPSRRGASTDAINAVTTCSDKVSHSIQNFGARRISSL